MRVSRRGVLAGAAVGGGLVVAWMLRPRSFATPLSPGREEFAFDAWIKIGADSVVTVAVPQLEMGQGVTTLLPQIVAQELGADWRQVAVEPAPSSGAYANIPLAAKWSALWMPWGITMSDRPDNILAARFAQDSRFAATADGTTLAAYEMPCRNAAAAARDMLTQEAASQWDVAAEECEAQAGFIIHGTRRATFGSLAAAASVRTPSDPPPLRTEAVAERPLPGQDDMPTAWPRLDLPAKVDGSMLFAGDVRLPDMLYAAIRHGPLSDAVLAKFQPQAVARNRRVKRVVKAKRWLAAVATDWWSAERALDAMAPRFGVAAVLQSERIEAALDEARASGAGHVVASRGSGFDAMEKPDFVRRYDLAPALHASLETASATARLQDGRLELWLASQAPEAARAAAAKAVGLAERDVVLYPMPAGGSFDARLEHPHAIEAALIARECSPQPVQLIWSRWQEHLASLPRSPASALVAARVAQGGNGTIAGIHTRIAVPATAREFGRRLFDNQTPEGARRASLGEADPLAVEGALPFYAIPEAMVTHVPVDTGLPAGRLRGNAHAMSAFFTECFIDEMAAHFGREPLSYRIEMLAGDPRMVGCLQMAAQMAQWDGGQNKSGLGLACHRIGPEGAEGHIACIATAHRDDGGVRVARIVAAVDIGRIVNIDIARQQIEGGLIFGMAQVNGASTAYSGGLPTVPGLGALNLPTLADCPPIEIDFIPGDSEPCDPGELGAIVAAPAIANALASATGLRFRSLPLLSEGL